MTARCQQIAADNGLIATSRKVNKDSLRMIHNALLDEWEGRKETLYIVYDNALFAYRDILEVFEARW